MSTLENWCKGEGVDQAHALVLKKVPVDATRDNILETLTTIKALGRVRTIGRMYEPQSQSLMVLCECSERVNLRTIPLDVPPVGGGELWTLHGPTDGEEATAGDGGDVPPAPDDSFPSTGGTTTPPGNCTR